ncbi:caspase activity and apoptosis inhibitor 1 [Spea bombifrons]|uniref:caspase activity and apoptosis inhibitor 1 n=1 Tax=Spea bombifrons TaxID=233779 RepID=UPI00234A7007|nr:caspase activity and apoptosis inhibitor 1 [Spea bombifrons]
MTGGKKSSKEKKKRRRSDSCETGAHVERKRRSTEQSQQDAESPHLPTGDNANEADDLSDIEEGGLDLNVPLKPISFYISDKKEMLQQCFRVVGEKKLQKMLPDLLKDYSLDEIKQLCLEQLQLLSEKKLFKILEGEQGIDSATEDECDPHVKTGTDLTAQYDNNVDSTTSLKDNAGIDDTDSKTGKGEDCDAISINADTFDSDIEGAGSEERAHETPAVAVPKAAGQQDDLVKDIEKSVNEILGLAEPVIEEEQSASVTVLAEDIQPSAQQLELLELEMRARAIKALMKAGNAKKACDNML